MRSLDSRFDSKLPPQLVVPIRICHTTLLFQPLIPDSLATDLLIHITHPYVNYNSPSLIFLSLNPTSL